MLDPSTIALMLGAIGVCLVGIVASVLLGRKLMRCGGTIGVKPCPECGHTALIANEVCPHCGAPMPH